MLESVTVAIAMGAFGLLSGAFFPALVAYAILFLRRHGYQLKTFLRLGGRFLAAFLLLGLMSGLIVTVIELLGADKMESDLEINSFAVGANIGFWGAIAGLIFGIRRARKSVGATQR